MITSERQTVVVLGASNKPSRYSFKAIKSLLSHGHRVIPVHPVIDQIEDLPVIAQLSQIEELVDTLTLYIAPGIGETMIADIIALAPRRIIFNPGTESVTMKRHFMEQGIEIVEDCTLVMLDRGCF